MGVDESVLPFLLEPSIIKFDTDVAVLFSQQNLNLRLSNSFLDILLKYEINDFSPSTKTNSILINFLVNYYEDFPKSIIYEKALKIITEKILKFKNIIIEVSFENEIDDDYYWELLSRVSIINASNNQNLSSLLEEMCISLNYGNFIKASNLLHCIILNNSMRFSKDKFCDLFIEQALEYLSIIKDLKLKNQLSWELTLFHYATKI